MILVTRRHAGNADAIIASANSFLATVKRAMKDYAPEEILNIDQIGLELELHLTRTSSHEGEMLLWPVLSQRMPQRTLILSNQ